MLNGNPNGKLPNVPNPNNSRYLQGRTDPMGLGIESLQGGAMQPASKINSIPGHGAMTLSPQLQRLFEQRRQANAATQQRRLPIRQRLGF